MSISFSTSSSAAPRAAWRMPLAGTTATRAMAAGSAASTLTPKPCSSRSTIPSSPSLSIPIAPSAPTRLRSEHSAPTPMTTSRR